MVNKTSFMIHELAGKVIAKRNAGNTDEALKMIAGAKANVLDLMIRLFKKVYEFLESEFTELAIELSWTAVCRES